MEVLKTRLNTEARFYGLGLGTYSMASGVFLASKVQDLAVALTILLVSTSNTRN